MAWLPAEACRADLCWIMMHSCHEIPHMEDLSASRIPARGRNRGAARSAAGCRCCLGPAAAGPPAWAAMSQSPIHPAHARAFQHSAFRWLMRRSAEMSAEASDHRWQRRICAPDGMFRMVGQEDLEAEHYLVRAAALPEDGSAVAGRAGHQWSLSCSGRCILEPALLCQGGASWQLVNDGTPADVALCDWWAGLLLARRRERQQALAVVRL